MKVTRIALSDDLNARKYAKLAQQAQRLASVRSLVWQRYGSVAGVRLSDRQVRDGWMVDGTATGFGVLANAWKETVRDAFGDIKASREAAKVKVRGALNRRTIDPAERKRLFTLLKRDQWTGDPYLSRLMRKYWRRGHNHTTNQIIVRSDQYRCYTLVDDGNVWLAVPGLRRREMVPIPLNTSVAPTGTLRLILRGDDRVEVHYQIDAAAVRSSKRPHGGRVLGVDKGYTEVLTDSDGHRHGIGLGQLLAAESDHLKVKNQRRAKLRSVAEKATEAGDSSKAERITQNNLGTVKRERRRVKFNAKVRTLTFAAVHAVNDKAAVVIAEDLSGIFGRKPLPTNMNRRLAAWTKGVTAEALASVSERRGSALMLVNAAYTAQVAPCCGALGRRRGDRLHCTLCGVVWQADHAAAINIETRRTDPDIGLYTPHTRVRQILIDRDRRRLSTAEPGLQPTGGERTTIHTLISSD